MIKPNSAEFGYFYTYCPIIWTLCELLFTRAFICDTLTLKRDVAKGYCNSL